MNNNIFCMRGVCIMYHYVPLCIMSLTLKLKRFRSFPENVSAIFPVCFRCFSVLFPEWIRNKVEKKTDRKKRKHFPEKVRNLFYVLRSGFWHQKANKRLCCISGRYSPNAYRICSFFLTILLYSFTLYWDGFYKTLILMTK